MKHTHPTTFTGPANASRRVFLRHGAALSALGGAAPFALNLATLSAAQAQTTSGYKAMVCIFLFGGNDAANMVLPTDTASWAAYSSVRSQQPDPIALLQAGTAPQAGAAAGSPAALGGVLPLVAGAAPANLSAAQLAVNNGRSFALHPSLGGVRALFDAERLAIVNNVGPLFAPTTKAQYQARSVSLPPKLFSHNDQQSLWQAYGPEGAQIGWGGRMGDVLAAANGTSSFTAISASGNAVFLSGNQVVQYQVSGNGGVAISGVPTGSSLFGSAAAAAALRTVLTGQKANLLEQDYATVVRRSIAAEERLRASFTPVGAGGVMAAPQYLNPITGTNQTNGLAGQLQTVARMIGARNALGMQRQVFMVSMGGFDTHDFQNRNHADLMARLSHALTYFDTALANMPGGDLRSQVVTFTASDIGRTFTSNGDGTDHGWGAHHFVMGGTGNAGGARTGSVKGAWLYGRMPQVGLNHPDEVGSGNWIPSVSVDQYGATMARWMGLSEAQLDDVFPNLRNFSGERNLGFMG